MVGGGGGSPDYISFRAGRVRPGDGRFKDNLIIFFQGGRRGVKTNLNKKIGGSRQIFTIFFSITSSDSIVFRWVGGHNKFAQKSREVEANFFFLVT